MIDIKKFINKDFLFDNETGKYLYEKYVKELPIIDYHSHLNTKEIYENNNFTNLTDIWLNEDHYKWRLMRANGVSENYVTGNASNYEKFLKWAETVPYLIGSPLFHWTHMELSKFFGIDELLSSDTANSIYKKVNQKLVNLKVRDFIKVSNVKVLATTDDPVDSLTYHKLINKEIKDFKVIPSFRPDKAINLDLESFGDWLKQLEEVIGYKISSYNELKKALKERIEYFNTVGANISDHGLDTIVYEEASEAELNLIFNKALKKEKLTDLELAKYKGNLLVYLGTIYYEYGWVQQYHIGASRNNSTKMFEKVGPDKGFDSIADNPIAKPLKDVLNKLDLLDKMPKTIIYTLNPRDFEVAITLMQSFQAGDIPGKLQFGASWWFLDNKTGIEKHLEALGNNGLLSKFVGMLTDSRSFLSFVRHDYFRRILCNYLGKQVEDGLYPNDLNLVGEIAANISYYNALNYFNFKNILK